MYEVTVMKDKKTIEVTNFYSLEEADRHVNYLRKALGDDYWICLDKIDGVEPGDDISLSLDFDVLGKPINPNAEDDAYDKARDEDLDYSDDELDDAMEILAQDLFKEELEDDSKH